MVEKLKALVHRFCLRRKLAILAKAERTLTSRLVNTAAAGAGNSVDGIHKWLSPEAVRDAFAATMALVMRGAILRNRGEVNLNNLGLGDVDYVELLVRGRVIDKLDQPVRLDALKVFLLDYARAFGRATAMAILKTRRLKTEGGNNHDQLLH